jgi:beta-glucosidase
MKLLKRTRSVAIIDSALEAKIDRLLAQMNLKQKVGQLTQPERNSCSPEDIKNYHIGSVLSGAGLAPGDNRPADWIKVNDAYWAASMEKDLDHLAIPIIYGLDAVHGNNNVLGATIFPHNIGLGAARDPDLLERIAQATAREVLATGLDWTFAPTLAVAQNIHWGRTYESYSEDPKIGSTYSAPFVRGLQGSLGDGGVVACVKHWLGDGGTTHGVDGGDTNISMSELRDSHMPPYIPAIKQGALTVMVSFNSWSGDKCHGHKYLISEVLKGELGFNGLVISDWDGIDYLSENYYEAVGMAINAGIDMFMVPERWLEFIETALAHVSAGTVAQSRIDDAVRRVLRVKYLAGLFDKPRPSRRRWSNSEDFGSQLHRDVAREAVRKSLVLLQNRGGILPLDKSTKILVAGKAANNRGLQCGGYTIAWQGVDGNQIIEGGTSIWEAITQVAPNAELSENGLGIEADKTIHDVGIVVVGERPYAEGMGDIRVSDDVIVETDSQILGSLRVLEPYGETLELAKSHTEDLQAIKNITRKGIPVVVIVLSGRPLITDQELAETSAFVVAWLPGSEGSGVSDVLFGDYDFQGKLSFSWPSKARNIEASGGHNRVLFPVGYGLSYAKP